MLNNKKLNIILSIAIAVCLWAYVIGETNPKDSKVFKNIPIEFINEEALDNSELAVLDASNSTVDVTLTGTRVGLSSIKPSEISATVDLADAAMGNNELKINIKCPDRTEVEDQSINKVTLSVERKAYKDVDINVGYVGEFGDDQEPLVVEMARTSVTVSGAESRVKSVVEAHASISATDVENKLKTITCELVPVNKNGTEVKNVNLSSNNVKITTELVKTKTVPLEVPIINNATDDIIRHTSTPKTVTLKGKSKELDKIESIKAEAIDISEITESMSLPIKISLPEGVQVSEQSLAMKANVTVEKLAEKKITFSQDDIEILGLENGLKAVIEDSDISVIFKGKQKELDGLSKADITLSLDLNGYREGSDTVEIKVTCDKVYSSYEVKPAKITVNIEKN